MTSAAADASTDHPLERLIFFSDAVFAIAITLLVIEIHIPHVPAGSPDIEYWHRLGPLIPKFIGFVMSFGVVGAFWMGHHRSMALARRFHPRIFGPNLLLLGSIAFMPFVAGFVSEHPGARVPAVVYWGWMVVASVLNLRVNRIVTAPPMLAADADRWEVAHVRASASAVAIASALSLVIAFVFPYAAPVPMATIPLWRRMLLRGAARPVGTDAPTGGSRLQPSDLSR